MMCMMKWNSPASITEHGTKNKGVIKKMIEKYITEESLELKIRRRTSTWK